MVYVQFVVAVVVDNLTRHPHRLLMGGSGEALAVVLKGSWSLL